MLKRGFNGFHGTYCCLYSFKSFILYSTSAPSKDGIPMVQFLSNSVGFSEKEAASIVTKVSYPFVSTHKSQLVVDFLVESGFDGTQIRKLLTNFPNILRNDVEKTLKPKVRVFEELGICGSDLGLVISQHPSVLTRSLKSCIVPTLEMLKLLLGSDKLLARVLMKTKLQLFYCNVIRYLPENLRFLQIYGVPSEKLRLLMQRRPLFLLQRTQYVEKIVKSVEERLGIPRTSGMFLHGVAALSKVSEDKIQSWLQVFQSYGWSQTDISKLLKRQPLCLNISEKKLRVKLDYFMKDLGYGTDYLATHPVLFSLSQKKRILPRTDVIQALREKQLLKVDVSLYTFLIIPESKFMETYVLPFKDKLPEIYQCYMEKTRSHVAHTKSARDTDELRDFMSGLVDRKL